MDDIKRMILLVDLKKAIARDDFTKLNIIGLYRLRIRVDWAIEQLKKKVK